MVVSRRAEVAERELSLGCAGGLLEDGHRLQTPKVFSVGGDQAEDGDVDASLMPDKSQRCSDGDLRASGRGRREENDMIVRAIDDALAKFLLYGQKGDILVVRLRVHGVDEPAFLLEGGDHGGILRPVADDERLRLHCSSTE